MITIMIIDHFYSATTTQRRSRLQHGYCIGVSRRSARATVSEGLAQGLYMSVRAGVEPLTLRLKVINSTKAPPCLSRLVLFIHSFIHYGDLYSAPSTLLLRSAPGPCTAKEKSFEARVKCVRKNPGAQSLRQRKPIPHRGANHRECTGLGCGGTSKRNKE